MRHFVVYPSADPVRGWRTAMLWRLRGFAIMIGFDAGMKLDASIPDTHVISLDLPFAGYYRVINGLVASAFERGADLVTCAADDMEPAQESAESVARTYFSAFGRGQGVMQACGDPQGKDATGKPAAARICGSPTFGREWHEHGYSRGPFFDGYGSFYGDEDLKNFADKRGLLWMNPAITIWHHHWTFENREPSAYQRRNQLRDWAKDEALFRDRKERGFPNE